MAVVREERTRRDVLRSYIPAIGILLLVGGCIHQKSGSEWDGGPGPDAAGTDVGTVCGARSPASTWAAWRMPSPVTTHLPNPASYTNLDDGTVRDDVTCLVWQRDVSENTCSWTEANDYCSSLPLAGGGWRLPTRIELVSLVDFTKAAPGPTIDEAAFPNTPSEEFWSSSLVAETVAGTTFAWYVYFSSGATSEYELFVKSRVRCVR
jgi:hypothetical protein